MVVNTGQSGHSWKGILTTIVAIFFVVVAATALAACTPAGESRPAAESKPPTEKQAAPQKQAAAEKPAAAEKFEWTYSSAHPADIVDAKAFQWYFQELNKRSGGRITVKEHYNAVLGKMADHIPMLGKGAVDLAFFSPGYIPAQMPLWFMYSLPYSTQNVRAYLPAHWGLYEQIPELKTEIEKNNITMLSISTSTPTYLFSTKSVRTTEELKPLKLRAFGNFAKWGEKVGMKVVSMPLEEVYGAFKQGIVDVSMSSLDAGYSQKWHEQAKYTLDIDAGIGLLGFLGINGDVWKKVPPDLQKMMLDLGKEASKQNAKTVEQETASLSEATRKAGVQWIKVSDGEVAKLRDAAAAVREEWIKEKEAAGLPGRKIIETYQSLIKRYEADPWKD